MWNKIQNRHPKNLEFTAAVLHLVHKFDTEAVWCEEAAVRVVRRMQTIDQVPEGQCQAGKHRREKVYGSFSQM